MKYNIFAVLAASLFMFASCHTEHEHEHSEEAETEEKDHVHANEIGFTKEQAAAAGLKIEVAKPSSFSSVIHTSGEIQSLQGDEQTVVATSSGVVNFINASITEGTSVGAGQALVSISAKNLQDGDPVLKAKVAYETAAKEFHRAERLVAEKIISLKEFEQIRLNYETTKATYIGQAANVTAKGVTVKSPISGYIKSRIVANGDFVNIGQPIAVVVKNKRLQLRADVSENYFKQLRGIRGANFRTTYDNEVHRLADLNGRLLSYGKISTGGASYIPVTFEFDNIGDIVPGSYADVYLLSAERENVISLPISAVTEEEGLYFVYVKVHDEVFVKQEVTLGENDGTRVEIVSGVKNGDNVVTHGAYQVKMAANSGEIPGHTHNH